MYPLKFKRHLEKKIWGGRNLYTELNIDLPDDELYGESWEISAYNDKMTKVENGKHSGKTLQELLEFYKEKLVGEKNYKKYGNKFPLLIKFLDVNDKLSIQVHPDDYYALKNEGDFGKNECWYILNASENAKIIVGVNNEVTKETFIKGIENRDFSNLFNIINVKKGDFISIPSGMVHGIIEGSMLIYEPQQNSDVTYRIYDFDRQEKGKTRELHLDKALDVIKFEPFIEKSKNVEISNSLFERITLSKNEFFHFDKIIVKRLYEIKTIDNFKIITVIEGQGIMVFKDEKIKITKGDTYFVPPSIELSFIGELELLETYIPNWD